MSNQSKAKKTMTISQQRRVGLILRWLLAVVLILFSVFPVIWIVSASLDPVNNLATQKLIPDNAGFENFRELINNPIFPFFTWLWNSIKVSVITTVLTLSLTTMAAFAFPVFDLQADKVCSKRYC